MKIHLAAILICFGLTNLSFAQKSIGKASINGQVFEMVLEKSGDTLYLSAADLDTVSLTYPRNLKTQEDYDRYRKYLRYAAVVYPYAKEAVAVFRQLNKETEEMRKGKRKRYAKHLQKDLDDKFEAPLKNLTKTQGKILVKMVEREFDEPLYELIKTYRGGMTAGYWNTASKLWGYDLKHGYAEGEDPILDAVLQDFILSEKEE
ncbi:MAG: DUF4294 domain-containing protein [Saprospiraceae bacterium]|nr:DUF4294 domain-containing protein [Saprospiraceae bacterium]